MMSPMTSRSLQSLLMSGSKYLPLRCFAIAAPAPLLSRRLLHLRSDFKNLILRHKCYRFRSFCSHRALASNEADVARPKDEAAVLKQSEKLISKLEELGIQCSGYTLGKYSQMLCPKCKGGRLMAMSLSLFIREDGKLAAWRCYRKECGWGGNLQANREAESHNVKLVKNFNDENKQVFNDENKQDFKAKGYIQISESGLNLEPLCAELIEYFAERMISTETLRRNAIKQRNYNGNIAIAFPYRRNGILVSCKYRGVPKKFWQEMGTEHIFFGLDDIKQASEVIIVEGEIDKLSMEEAGYPNCVSVPNGAPSKLLDRLPVEEEDTGFQYLWNCKDYLEEATRIVLATDADGPGEVLAEELARRLGRERCCRIKWPNKSANEVCKDANEVLMYFGPEALKELVKNAEFYPIRGLFEFSDFFREIDAYYHLSRGFELGISTGWRALDELYKIVPGELTVITGVPNSGKSEWIDALMCNINESQKWKFVLCSMENKVRDHARKLLEKHLKKPFFNARYGGSTERMSVQELEQGKQWLHETFYLIRCDDDSLPSVKWVLERARAAVHRYGVRGLVIDPYNELDHQRASSQTETEYVSQMLTKIKRFAQHYACHVWFVAHPKQLQNWGGGPPNMYDISGSAHFINKCDNGIVVHRNRDENVGPLDLVQVCVRKVRNKVIGSVGDAFLTYDRITGEFKDVDDDDVGVIKKSGR